MRKYQQTKTKKMKEKRKENSNQVWVESLGDWQEESENQIK